MNCSDCRLWCAGFPFRAHNAAKDERATFSLLEFMVEFFMGNKKLLKAPYSVILKLARRNIVTAATTMVAEAEALAARHNSSRRGSSGARLSSWCLGHSTYQDLTPVEEEEEGQRGGGVAI